MESKEVLSAMTPAPWEVHISDGKFTVYHVVQKHESGWSEICKLFTATMDLKEGQPANAIAIVSAVNATWGSGIDPEAVPELMHAVLSFIAGMNEEESFPGHSEAYLTQVCLPRAEAAIAKANLKP